MKTIKDLKDNFQQRTLDELIDEVEKELDQQLKDAQKIYDYESKRIEGYKKDFEEAINNLDIIAPMKRKLKETFEWYGNARAIKSKAYQTIKKLKD